ncbi:F-box protein At2g26850 isoform X1 [Cajanus cajan]|uniref:F-box protein At2g26850 isoform X1 n=1 Tax=Cajanus cajan TaxID=3821 RepID=UPI0010FBAEA2|nr:F-box protein At2g26850 isoform X1 [Cajanus cajan]
MDIIGNICLLNLPEPILDCILKLLSPMELIEMSEVCTYLRDRCRSDPLWEEHVKKKWGRVIGGVAYEEWKWHITTAKEKGIDQLSQHGNQNRSLGSFYGTWPMLYLRSYLEDCNHLSSSLANCFMMTLYFSLENGKFWFPAQIYRGSLARDALVRYNSKTDNFEAREQNGGWHSVGSNIQWDILRVPPVDTPPCDRHISDCLQDLKPGDHIEIQRKSRREIAYDWWYAVIGHMESCSENEKLCRCGDSEKLIVEFKQYYNGSRMRRVMLLRNGEQSGETTAYYGGIRKLHSAEEIQRWEKLLPPHQTPFIQMGARIVCRGMAPRRGVQ